MCHSPSALQAVATPFPPVCRACDQPITNPDDAIYLGHEMGNSGPGWDIRAHRPHAHLVGPDPDATRIRTRVLAAKALRHT